MYRVLLVEDEEIELETLRDYIDWKKNGISRVELNWQRRSYAGGIHAKLFF